MIRTLIICIIGSTLEWYDFAIFGVLSPVISKIFFPAHNSVTALMLTFALFATGFIMRPLGGIFFGHIGDKYGRRKAIIGSVVLMTVATVAIGLLPTEHAVFTTVIVLLILRLLQGFAVSGEYAGMFTFIAESVPSNRFFFYQSFVCVGSIGGFLLGTIIGSLALSFTHSSYAWRIPFLASFILGGMGLYLRLKATETPIYQAMLQKVQPKKFPLGEVVSKHHRVILFVLFGLMVEVSGIYFALVYYPTHVHQLGINTNYGEYLSLSSIAMIFLIITAPIIGFISRPKNIITMLSLGMLGYIILPVIVMLNLSGHSLVFAVLGQLILFVPVIFLETLFPPLTALLFPTKSRYSGVALSINLCVCIFGGTTPLVALWLANLTHTAYAPALYISGLGIISLLVLLLRKQIILQQYQRITEQLVD